MNNLDLTIVTITYNNETELLETYNSIESLIANFGVNHIIINGGDKLKNIAIFRSEIIQEKDNGIYNALNKGVNKVKTNNLIPKLDIDFFIRKGSEIIQNDKAVIDSRKEIEDLQFMA